MPTYDYRCSACEETLEIFHGMTEASPKVCPSCARRGTLSKLVSAGSGVIFKGSGFYATDYKGNGKRAASKESETKKVSEKKAEPTKSKGGCGSGGCGCSGD